MTKIKLTQNRWNDKELELLQSLRNKDLTYGDVANVIKSKNVKEIQNKCENMRITKDFRNMNGWCKSDIELLRELYPITPNEQLPIYFNGKSKGAIYIQANRMGLKKTYNHRKLLEQNQTKWNDDKNSELIITFKESGEYLCYKNFQCKYGHNREYIRNKLIENNLLDVYNIKNKDNANLSDVFNIYKLILNGKISGFNKTNCKPTKSQIVLLFKYYIKIKNINISKNFLLNVTYGEILKKSGLQGLIKNRFNGYYEFISCCYPKYCLKAWEFKRLDVPSGFWSDKYNRFWCIREGLKRLVEDNIITYAEESIGLEKDILSKYMSSSLLYYHKKDCIIEYFDFIKNYNYNNAKIYNGVRFDSYQEKQVYRYIFQNITQSIYKCNKKDGFYFFNSKYNENYIPDFYIKIGNKFLIIEYFGMYNPNHSNSIFKEYCNKTKRKIEYYNSLDNVCFIDFYPKDLTSGFKGVSNKLTSFFDTQGYCITEKGGEIDG